VVGETPFLVARITVALACPKTIQQYASLATRHMYFHLFIIVCYLANKVLLLVAAIINHCLLLCAAAATAAYGVHYEGSPSG